MRNVTGLALILLVRQQLPKEQQGKHKAKFRQMLNSPKADSNFASTLAFMSKHGHRPGPHFLASSP